MLFGSAMVIQLVLSEVGVVAAGYGAVVGLLPCMSPHVVISISYDSKLFRAECARVRFLMSMHSSDVNLYDAKI